MLASGHLAVHQAAGFMLLFSCFLLLEGMARVNLVASTPSGEWKGNHTTFPPILLLIGAVGEVLFAMVAIGVSWGVIVHDFYSALWTKVALATQAIFGWFVFIVYVLAQPSFQVARLTAAGIIPGLSEQQTKGVIMMGLTGSIAVCASLQGALFFFTLQLLHVQQGQFSSYSSASYLGRTIYYSSLVCIKGASEIAIGSILLNGLGKDRYPAPVVSPPFVVTHSQLSIADGILVLFVGLMGIHIAILRMKMACNLFSWLCVASLVVQFGLYDMGQIGVAKPAAIVGALQVGLTIALMFMPGYCAVKLAADSTEVDSSETQKMGGHEASGMP